jgi:hypothetical protein
LKKKKTCFFIHKKNTNKRTIYIIASLGRVYLLVNLRDFTVKIIVDCPKIELKNTAGLMCP